MAWPRHARRWTAEQIANDAATARNDFRRRRFAEPKSRYLGAFAEFETANRWLVERLGSLLDSDADASELREVLADENLSSALRYIGAPPISSDDLKTLAESALTTRSLESNAFECARVRDVLRNIVDPKRFPWFEADRAPNPEEKRAAVLASSVLGAAQRVHTARRGDERAAVEGAVRGLLEGMGFELCLQRPRSGIQSLRLDAPAAGKFMLTVNLGADNADVVVGLADGRVLAIECKGSNSEINSRKRLNKEAAQNARAWVARFGDEVVPAAAIQGVFKPAYIAEAQETPMVIFWGHRLADLRDFIASCRPVR